MPVAPVRLSLSDPAKSTKWNFAVSDSMSSGFAGAFMVQIWEIFHVHLNMYFSHIGNICTNSNMWEPYKVPNPTKIMVRLGFLYYLFLTN